MTKERTLQIEKWEGRPFSWSQISSWGYDPEQWFTKYILGKEESPTPAMLFGNVVGDSLGTPKSMIPKLEKQLVGIKEYELAPKLDGIQLVGYCDHFCKRAKILNENKTSQNQKRWNQESTDRHEQFDMYALMIMLQDNIMPEELTMYLNYIPVIEGQDFKLKIANPNIFYVYETKRLNQQALQFGVKIKKTRKEMKKYACEAA